MTGLLISLFAGILIGIFKIFPEKHLGLNGKIQILSLIILLFTMGASIGANKDLLSNISTMGIKALMFAVLTSVFSIGILYLFTKTILVVKSDGCDDEERLEEGM